MADWPVGHDELWAGPITAKEVGYTLPLAALMKAIVSQTKKENRELKN